MIGVVEGGYDVNERVRSATETAKRPVAGLLTLLLPTRCHRVALSALLTN